MRDAQDDFEIVSFDGSREQMLGALSVAEGALGPDDYPEAGQAIERMRAMDGQMYVSRDRGCRLINGFVTCFGTRSLKADRVEADLLAVAGPARGRGIGAALVKRATTVARQGNAHEMRAAIRLGNGASERVFARAGYVARPEHLELWTLRPRTSPATFCSSAQVTPTSGASLPALAERWPAALPSLTRARSLLGNPYHSLLVGWEASGPVGMAELLEVHTLTYRGIWLETLIADRDDVDTLACLAWEAGRWALARALDLAGVLVAPARENARAALQRCGYRLSGVYRSWVSRPGSRP